ncbi:MAG: hypothetical protein AAF533_17835 [Acidobacteriota bacterium]
MNLGELMQSMSRNDWLIALGLIISSAKLIWEFMRTREHPGQDLRVAVLDFDGKPARHVLLVGPDTSYATPDRLGMVTVSSRWRHESISVRDKRTGTELMEGRLEPIGSDRYKLRVPAIT